MPVKTGVEQESLLCINMKEQVKVTLTHLSPLYRLSALKSFRLVFYLVNSLMTDFSVICSQCKQAWVKMTIWFVPQCFVSSQGSISILKMTFHLYNSPRTYNKDISLTLLLRSGMHHSNHFTKLKEYIRFESLGNMEDICID